VSCARIAVQRTKDEVEGMNKEKKKERDTVREKVEADKMMMTPTIVFFFLRR
jgi:hypothetical protein